MGMVEFLANAPHPRVYFDKFRIQTQQMSDSELGREIAKREHIDRDAGIRMGIGLGAGAIIYSLLPNEIRPWAIGPGALTITLSSATRGILRESEEEILHRELESRYPKEITLETSPRYKPAPEPVQVFPAPELQK